MQAPSELDMMVAQPALEHYPENDAIPQRILIDRFPYRIGRNPLSEFVIYSRQVSGHHAEIFCQGGSFRIRDLRSTNGTFVNRVRIQDAPLRNNDIVHIAHKEFRFTCEDNLTSNRCTESAEIQTDPVRTDLPLSVIYGREILGEILERHHVRIAFQPIINLHTQEVIGYEALGRGTHNEFSPNPADLFRLAEKCGLAPQLSRLFRLVAIHETAGLPGLYYFFLNIHPSEMEDQGFVQSLSEVVAAFRSGRHLVVEVHENVVADTTTMKRLRHRLDELGVALAYDDFGAGQSRLAELTEVPPDFIKLDMKLVRGIDQSPARQDLIGGLGTVASRLGVKIIAEGVETWAEAEMCRRLGCQLGQGFLFGHPKPANSFPQVPPPATRRVDVRAVLARLKERQAEDASS